MSQVKTNSFGATLDDLVRSGSLHIGRWQDFPKQAMADRQIYIWHPLYDEIAPIVKQYQQTPRRSLAPRGTPIEVVLVTKMNAFVMGQPVYFEPSIEPHKTTHKRALGGMYAEWKSIADNVVELKIQNCRCLGVFIEKDVFLAMLLLRKERGKKHGYEEAKTEIRNTLEGLSLGVRDEKKLIEDYSPKNNWGTT